MLPRRAISDHKAADREEPLTGSLICRREEKSVGIPRVHALRAPEADTVAKTVNVLVTWDNQSVNAGISHVPRRRPKKLEAAGMRRRMFCAPSANTEIFATLITNK